MLMARVLEAVAITATKPTRLTAVINFATLSARSLAKNAFSTKALTYPKAIVPGKEAIPKRAKK